MSDSSRREQYTPEAALLEARINDIKMCVGMIGRENKYAAGLTSGIVKGIMLGATVSLILFGIVFHYFVTLP